jgi:hypothetical protein
MHNVINTLITKPQYNMCAIVKDYISDLVQDVLQLCLQFCIQ